MVTPLKAQVSISYTFEADLQTKENIHSLELKKNPENEYLTL